MLDIRLLIFETALQTPGVGPLTETLKWGEPAYLTTASKSGSTLRLGWTPKAPDQVAIYLNCKTTLVDTFRNLVPDDLVYAGNRAILLAVSQPLPTEALTVCLRLALTYHGAKRTPPLSR